MKKKCLLSVLIFVISFFVLGDGIKAASLTISESSYPEIEIHNNGTKLRQINIIKTSSGEKIYCMDMLELPPQNGYQMTADSKALEDSKVYAYIINNSSKIQVASTVSYKSKNFNTQSFEPIELDVASINYLNTQLAIWYYQNNGVIRYNIYVGDEKPDITANVLAVYSGIKELVAEAKSSKNTLNVSPKVEISSNINMRLSSDGKTFESDEITVTSNVGNILLSLTSKDIKDGKIYDVNGNEVSKVSSGSKVIIRVPVESVRELVPSIPTFTLTATTETTKYEMYEYRHVGVQTVGKLTSKKINDKKSVSFDIKETVTKFSKVSVVNQEELPGAQLRILNENKEAILDEEGNSLYEWVSGEEPHYIYGLQPGKYYLEEVISPEGYVLSNELVEFEVKNDGTITEVIMENDLEVEVPDTLSSRSILLLFIGMIDIALGIGILLYVKKNKTTE